jgi:hypothetical protein
MKHGLCNVCWEFLTVNCKDSALRRHTTYTECFCIHFFYWWRAPQQTLRTQRSLEASCATLWWKWRWWLLFFVLFLVMEHRWDETDSVKPKYSGEKPVSVPLCPPQIPHGLTPGSNAGLRSGGPAANRLSHGTAFYVHSDVKYFFPSTVWRRCGSMQQRLADTVTVHRRHVVSRCVLGLNKGFKQNRITEIRAAQNCLRSYQSLSWSRKDYLKFIG